MLFIDTPEEEIQPYVLHIVTFHTQINPLNVVPSSLNDAKTYHMRSEWGPHFWGERKIDTICADVCSSPTLCMLCRFANRYSNHSHQQHGGNKGKQYLQHTKPYQDPYSSMFPPYGCCLPTPLTLLGWSRIFPLVSANQLLRPPGQQCTLRRGLSTNPGVTMWCVCGCYKGGIVVMYVIWRRLCISMI